MTYQSWKKLRQLSLHRNQKDPSNPDKVKIKQLEELLNLNISFIISVHFMD
jgi:hypothetical protein